MQLFTLKRLSIVAFTIALILASLALSIGKASAATEAPVGAVYTLTNAAAGNAVLVFNRSANGTLKAAGQYYAGGNGSGAGLGSQGALVLNQKGKRIFVVNAGSNSISVLAVKANGLQLLDTVDSQGISPTSITVHKRLVYVLNAGGDGNIAGFKLKKGKLSANGSVQPLSGTGIAPGQISFSNTGNVLVVTEKNTDKLDTYLVDANGQASAPNVQVSSGPTPFGFGFNSRGTLIVSEAHGAAASSVSSYSVAANGVVTPISPAVDAPNQKAACWIVTTKNGRFAYTSNAASGSITGYRVSNSGALKLLNSDGVTGVTAGNPSDMALSHDSQYLYALNNGLHTIDIFALRSDGSLQKLVSAAGLPAGTAGLAAR